MDVYVVDGDLCASDHYSNGLAVKYEPDVCIIMSLDNRRGELDPVKAYDIGTSWDLSDKFVEKY